MDFPETITTISLILSVASLCIYFFSYRDTQRLSIMSLNRAHRPYVFARTFTETVDGKYNQLMNQTLISVYNAPSFIKKRKITILKRQKGIQDEIIFENKDDGSGFIYPLDTILQIVLIDETILSHDLADKDKKTFIRIVEIEYTWIAKEAETYYFKSEDYYSVKYKTWQLISENAT
jgi:hypothetical protein